ncbi:MAG TPA: cysteine synthase A [Candidatus Fusicatenibacter merdavium]|uniref:Cysteine synthase n=1 Tax=Candidatus Fusicatenibacter merdavium TaxID=2838600 RepID=A0A9D1XAU0_9FIRM|nr:cysteine synthase A [Candidatus Fusicatenibacter merdavium]
MAKIYRNIAELIGNTPLLELTGMEKKYRLNCRLLAKLEYLNPTGSVKDRAALGMVRDALDRGILAPGATIVEPTSGNTGIGLAALAASEGFRLILTMPETMSVERRKILKAYGAEIVLTDGARGMEGAIEKAQELVKQIPGSFLPGQFENPANARAHFETTGPELWRDTDGALDVFVASVGSGGTITGTGRYLKQQNPGIRVVAVEPETSPVLSGGSAGPHAIQGIGAGFVPDVLDTEVYDEILTVNNEDPFLMGKELAKTEGIQVGISSGAALYAALKVAERPESEGKTIVVLLPDSADRYYSTDLF